MTDALAINLGAPCWLFQGYVGHDGYGQKWNGSRVVRAHRYMWVLMRGPIPENLQIDHLCRVRNCVNPQHMELVTNVENILRGKSFSAINARKTHCPQGHPYSDENTWRGTTRFQRLCKTCVRLRVRAIRARRKS